MITVSDRFLERVGGSSRYFPVRCKFDGIDGYITERSENGKIKTGSFTDIIDGNNILSVGNACANKIELTIINFTQAYVWKGARFTAEIALIVDGVAEWIPLGTFWVTDMSTPNHGKTVYLTAYDRMYKLSKTPYITALTAPFHYRDLLNEFLVNTGMTLSTTEELPEASDEDYMILSWPENKVFTYADIAGHLAGMVLCNAHISRADASVMEIKWYTPTGTKIHNTLQQDGFERLADSMLRVDIFVTGSNNEIVIENTDNSNKGELDFRPFDSEDPADHPWLTFTYDEATLTASVRITESYKNDTQGFKIPYALYVDGKTYNVTTVELGGFKGCMASAIVLPDTLTTIEGRAFEDCTGLTELTIPANVTSLSIGLVNNCTNLKTLYYNAVNATNASGNSSNLFGYSALETAIIGEGVQAIPHSLLRGASELAYVSIPNTVTRISSYAFYDCGSLKTITIPESVITFGVNLFGGSSSALETIYYNAVNATNSSTSSVINSEGLQTIEFGMNVRTIPQYLCRSCESLKNVRISGGLQTINTGAFYGCESLESITLPASITTIASTAFKNCDNITSIVIYKAADAVSGSPWGAENAVIEWLG